MVNLSIMEVKNMSNQKLIDFNGDYEKAISLFDYLHKCYTNSVRLIIDFSYDTRGCVGSYGVNIQELEEDDKLSDAFNNN